MTVENPTTGEKNFHVPYPLKKSSSKVCGAFMYEKLCKNIIDAHNGFIKLL